MTEKTTASKITAVKGMNDILPQVSHHWDALEGHAKAVLMASGYQQIRTPIVEATALFERGTGQTTDIVEKEMYAFEDRMNGDHLCLRPENTPGVVRAAIEHNLTYNGGQRLFYMGPMFRHEKPQRGRYRQFHQLGAEALGFAGPEIDAEMMVMVHRILQRLLGEAGMQSVRVEMNSLGVPAERQAHRAALIAYFEQHADLLDTDAKRRLHSNPLRILDTKNPAMQGMVQAAPQLLDFLGEASLAHLDQVKVLLTACQVPWSVNPRLVRGLDYYSHTVFEFVTDQLGAQGTICGGGRYDGLFEILGGKPTPAVGWAMGVERLLDLMATQQQLPTPDVPNAYAIITQASSLVQVLPLLQQLRSMGISVVMHASSDQGTMGSMKSQFKKADASGAHFALVFGDDEVAAQQVTIKSLRVASQDQQTMSWQVLLQKAASLLQSPTALYTASTQM